MRAAGHAAGFTSKGERLAEGRSVCVMRFFDDQGQISNLVGKTLNMMESRLQCAKESEDESGILQAMISTSHYLSLQGNFGAAYTLREEVLEARKSSLGPTA
eukprot:TRINITY_DN23826_c0_g1_i4.p1 TRINITY_DN23826_c0_g1~~TRINITY_DN23826_c0_g1_i4.p1  ORF type:complete len:102 (+),score=19.72 TRINITY_DN23826_c0_g1_i4:892-1197(+)